MSADGCKVTIEANLRDDPIIIVTDKDSGRVIREIPPRQLRELAAKLEQLRGLFLDKRA